MLINKITIYFFAVICFLAMSACKQQNSYDYFIRHPEKLEQTLTSCETSASTYCDEVRRAKQDFIALVNERVENPELFGQKILNEEFKQANLAENLRMLKKSRADTTQLKAAEEAYQEQTQKVNALLAVVAATSAE